MSYGQKVLAVVFVLTIAFALYGRWTGKSFQFTLVGLNQLGQAMANA